MLKSVNVDMLRHPATSSVLGYMPLSISKSFASQICRTPSARTLSSTTPGAGSMAKKLHIESRYRMNSGHEIPVLGFGVYQTSHNVATDVVQHAIKVGYRHVDSAVVYRNEAASAAGMVASKIPRSSLFFTSKIPPASMSYEAARRCVDETIAKINPSQQKGEGLGYVDLYLLHAPYGGREGRIGAWRALVEAVEAGKVKSIGVSNYGVRHLDELEKWMKETEKKEGKGKGGILSVNQVELHPWLARKDIVQWCQSRGVVLEAYSPLVRATRMNDPLLKPLCKKYGKTPAQVLVRWSLQKGFVPLPKSVSHARIEENAHVYDFELSGEDMKSLDTDEYSPCTWDPTTSKD